MENKMTVTNEVLSEKIDGIITRVKELQVTTQGFNATFVSHEVFELRLKGYDVSIGQINNQQLAMQMEIDKLKSKRLVPAIILATVASIGASAFTYLLYARLAK